MFATQSLISGMIFVMNGLKANIYLIYIKPVFVP